MASLEVPAGPSPAISPKTSAMPLRPKIIPQQNSLGPVGHNRRASQEDISPAVDSAVSPHTIVPGGIELPLTKFQDESAVQHDNVHRFTSKSMWAQESEEGVDRHTVNLIAVDELELPHADGKLPTHHHHTHHVHLGVKPIKTIYAGPSGNQKQLEVPAELLEAKSQYFRKLFEHDPDLDHMVFNDTDPIAMGMWMRWIVIGKIEKPDSFHSLTHWFALYAISVRFDMEELRNHAMDVIRHYYRSHVQTASPFRLEYIYKFTPEQDMMRNFVVGTAAARALVTGDISGSMHLVLSKGGDLSIDFAQALIDYSRNPSDDVRGSPDCQWHIHHHTQPCGENRAVQVDGAWDADHDGHCSGPTTA